MFIKCLLCIKCSSGHWEYRGNKRGKVPASTELMHWWQNPMQSHSPCTDFTITVVSVLLSSHSPFVMKRSKAHFGLHTNAGPSA